MAKSPQMEETLEGIAKIAGFKQTRAQADATKTCISCGGEAKVFKDDLSAREYEISKFCQKCQDEVFGG